MGVLISGNATTRWLVPGAHNETPFFSAGLLVGGIVIGLGLPETIRAQVPGYVTKQVFKTDLVNLPGQEVIIYASEWPSGFRLPLHQHEEGHEFVYVIEGEQTFEIDGVGTKIVVRLCTRPRIRSISAGTLLTNFQRR